MVILDSSRNPLPSHGNLQSAGIMNEQHLFIEHKSTTAVQWPLYIAIFALVVGFVGILTMSLVYGLSGGKVPYDFGVIMDAGSSKTNVILYQWPGSKQKGTGCVKQSGNCKRNGGIAKQDNATGYINQLMGCISDVSKPIPRKSETALYFAATAGMRLLNLSDSVKAGILLNQVEGGLNKSGLSVKSVSIISGRDEGIYAWTSSNFLKKTLETPNSDLSSPITYGALDLGGASTQITFELPPTTDLDDSIETLELYGENHTVFSKSYLCFGRDEIARRYRALLVKDPTLESINDPCTPIGVTNIFKGDFLFNQTCTNSTNFNNWLAQKPEIKTKNYTFVGQSDYDNCKKAVTELTEENTCKKLGFKECFKKPQKQPDNQKFLAFANFYFTTLFLNLTSSSLEQYVEESSAFCKLSVNQIFPNSSYKDQICFNAVYIYQVLVEGYGFNETTWSNLEFVGDVDGNEIGWALGYMINSTNIIPRKKLTEKAVTPATLTVLLLIFIITVVATVVYIFHIFCQKKRQFSPSNA